MSFKEDPLEQISFTQDDILLQGLPQIKSQGINNSSKQESQVQNLNLDLQSRSKRHESIGRILEEKTQPISKMQDYQQNQQTFESAASYFFSQYFPSQRMNIGITQQHQRSNGGSSVKIKDLFKVNPNQTKQQFYQTMDPKRKSIQKDTRQHSITSRLPSNLNQKEDLRRNMNEAFSENLPTIKSKSKSQSQNTELKMKIQELQKINRIKRGLNNIEDSYDDGSLERSTNKSNKNNKIKPGNTNIASTMSKDNLISINSLSASKKFNSNLNTSQIVKPQHKNRPLNILQDDRYSKERLLETAYNLNDEINQQTPISEVAQNQVKHQQDKSYLDSPNKTLLSFKKQSNISDKVNESFLSFDNESTILAISKISQKGQSNNSSFIGGRQSNRKILPQLPSNFNENSNNDFIDPIKVNIKYKNIIQNGEKTQRNHQSSKSVVTKDIQAKSGRKRALSPIKDGYRLESPTQMVQNQLENINWIYQNLPSPLRSSRDLTNISAYQDSIVNHQERSPQNNLKRKISPKEKQLKEIRASKKKLLESKEQLNGSQSPSQNLFTPLRDPCDQKLLCSSIGQSRSISPKVFTNLGKRSDSIVSQMKLKNGLDPNGRSPGSIKKPPPFKLKDLHKYSKTLKVTDIDPMLFNRVLDSKNKNKGRQSKSPPQNNQQSPPRSPNRNIEWTKTPVYKQFMLKLTEMESLEDNQIGFRKHKMRNPKKTLKQFELDLKNKKLMYQLMEEVLSNIYTEQEVQYFITILKNKNLNDDEMVSMWIKVGDTLEVLMCKLGLKDQYDRMMDQYDEEKKDNLRKTIIKLLCRCKIMYGSISHIKTIFRIMRQRQTIESQIIEYEREIKTNNLTMQLEDIESQVAQYCFQSSRLFIQITQFMIDSQLFKRLKFIYEGLDYQAKIRKQVQYQKEQFKEFFGDKLPTMNAQGKLIFVNELIQEEFTTPQNTTSKLQTQFQ